ncbi:MAG: hypothetical protein ACI9LX_003398 [Paraglaciecola sp.]|jgi:hypothetical protein
MKSLLTHSLKMSAIAMTTVMTVGWIVMTGKEPLASSSFLTCLSGAGLDYGCFMSSGADVFAADVLGQSHESLTNWQ